MMTILVSAITAAAFAFSGYLKNKAKDEKETLDWTELGKVTLAGFIIGLGANLGLQLDEVTSIGLSLFLITAGKNVYKYVTAYIKNKQ